MSRKLHFELGPDADASVERLKQRTGLDDLGCVKKGLVLLQLYLDTVSAGGTMVITTGDAVSTVDLRLPKGDPA